MANQTVLGVQMKWVVLNEIAQKLANFHARIRNVLISNIDAMVMMIVEMVQMKSNVVRYPKP